jgi:integrase
MVLTDAHCRGEKPGPTRRKLSDGGGLQFWVLPNGKKNWTLIYQYRGRQKSLALGPYPQISLSLARSKRQAAKVLLREGKDPAVEWAPPPIEVGQPLAITFEEIGKEFLEKRKKAEKLSDVTVGKKEWLLSLAYPSLGAKKVSEIRPVDVLAVLQELEARGTLETARRLRALIGAVCRYAALTERGESDPTAILKGAIASPKVTSYAAIVEPTAFGGLLRAIDNFDGEPTTVAGLKLLALLFPRPGELRYAQWPEFNETTRVWTIPKERMKMRREHQVPLPRQALEILADLRKIAGRRKYLFTGLIGIDKPLSENTLNLALRRMGYAKTVMTSHGFRSSASTMLNESKKWHEDAIERQLAHIETNGVRRAYARGTYWNERVEMMQWWADYLDKLRRERANSILAV